jgi:hypothetical protein
MKLSMRTGMDDLIRALRWQRATIMDTVMIKRKNRAPLNETRRKMAVRRARLKASFDERFAAP